MVNTRLPTSAEAYSCRYKPDGGCRFAIVCTGEVKRLFKPKGNSIALPGVVPSSVYLLHEGVVGLFRAWPTGEETVVALYTPGSIFGVTSVLEDWEPRRGQFLGHIRAVTSIGMCQMDPRRFLSYACGDPLRAKYVVRLTVEQIRDAHRMAALPVRRGPDKALAHILALLAEKASESCEGGWLISSFFTHQELADLARLTRSTATRALHELHRRGLIDFERKQIKVLDVEKLWAIVEDEDSSFQ